MVHKGPFECKQITFLLLSRVLSTILDVIKSCLVGQSTLDSIVACRVPDIPILPS